MENTSQATTPVVHPHVPFPLPAHHVFGGFWMRFAALMIDRVIMAIPVALLFAIVVIVGAASRNPTVTVILMALFIVLAVAWSFAYYIIFTGVKSTTPGKMLFGMRIVREDNGHKISWGQAFGRTFAYILSNVIMYIGYIIAAFDGEKRALHDHLAKTRVVRDTMKSTTAGWVVFGILMAMYIGGIAAAIALAPTTVETQYDDWDWEQEFGDERTTRYDDPGSIVAGADYDEGYRAGYTDGRGENGAFGDTYMEPATESRRADYEMGYVDGFLAGCADGNFDCSEVENAYYGSGTGTSGSTVQ